MHIYQCLPIDLLINNRFIRIEHVDLTGRSTRALKELTHEMRQVCPLCTGLDVVLSWVVAKTRTGHPNYLSIVHQLNEIRTFVFIWQCQQFSNVCGTIHATVRIGW